MEITHKKVRTLTDMRRDPRIERVVVNYDGYGRHMVEFKDGYKLNGETTVDIGSVKDLCYGINEQLEKIESPCEKELNGGERCDSICADCAPKYLNK